VKLKTPIRSETTALQSASVKTKVDGSGSSNPKGTDVSRPQAAPCATGSAAPFEDESELVRRARENDPAAVDRLIRRYQKKVYSIAYQMSDADAEDARDNAQEAFIQVFRNLGRFEGRSQFSTWLYRVVVNTCLDARRRRRRWLNLIFSRRPEKGNEAEADTMLDNLPAPEDATNPISNVSGQELRRDVTDALRRLSEKQRTVFQLKVFQEMSVPEIAAATGMAEGTVKSHLFRATQSVREQLHRWADT
jgi:RNA polymerase sigma-70 factor (ECF subfamily)